MILTIIMPFHHEGKSIIPALQGLQGISDIPHEILLVHDDKNDPTLPVIKGFQETSRCLQVLMNVHRPGVGGALRTGLEKARGGYLLFLVADDPGPLSIIRPMIELMNKGYDVVSGTRYSKGAHVSGGGVGARVMSAWGNRLFYWAASCKFSDATCGIKMFRRDILEKIKLNMEGGWTAAFELAIQSQRRGLKTAEIPYKSYNRLDGGPSHFKTVSRALQYGRIFLDGVRMLRFEKIDG
ncbi:MAG: glycosyltransferase family 2 protein [Candidatus Omnitrophica bacterium]|nr:glycosyltransferase family 2 protein [Candidatus Omnitrophota bacterium]MDE2221658.1 glycosyltransferase family 2 protein [Candidatus Omnitrophota bacterium]